MVRRMRHRGPSGEALWGGESIAIGIARLAIVAPNQPARTLESETGDVVGVANGEIWLRRCRCANCVRAGTKRPGGPRHRAAAAPLRGARRPVPRSPDGMFAVALWDRATPHADARARPARARSRSSTPPPAGASRSRPSPARSWRCRGCRAVRRPTRSRATSCTVTSPAPTRRSPNSNSCRQRTRSRGATARSARAAGGVRGRAARERRPSSGRDHARARRAASPQAVASRVPGEGAVRRLPLGRRGLRSRRDARGAPPEARVPDVQHASRAPRLRRVGVRAPRRRVHRRGVSRVS